MSFMEGTQHILYKLVYGGASQRMYKGNGTNSRHISWLYLFLGGFLIGILSINIWRNTFFGEMDLLSAASLSRLKYLDINGNSFLAYILKERIGTLVILCLLATTYVGTVTIALYAAWMGMMAGIFLSVAAMRYGLRGIFLILAGVMPQYLLLVPAYIMLMNWCYQICTGLYYPHKVYEDGYGMKRQYYMKKIVQLFVIVMVVIIGSMIESYVNPILISRFLKIF